MKPNDTRKNVKMSKTVFLTGSNGLVGSAVLRYLLDNTDWSFLLPTTGFHHGSQTRLNNTLRYAEDHRLMYRPLQPRVSERVLAVRCDLSQPFTHSIFRGAPTPDYILNIASESHVDRSLTDPVPFVLNNVALALNVLEYAREVQPKIYLGMNTDETMGNAREDEAHQEWEPFRPSNPYAASKASMSAIEYSYWRSFGVPVIQTHTMNLISPPTYSYQSTEKFVPMVIKKLLNGESVDIHVDENGKSGTRKWIDVRDFAAAWKFLLDEHEGNPYLKYYPHQLHVPFRYNIAGEERSNRGVAESLAESLGVDNPDLRDVSFHQSRPGHDSRYSLDDSKIRSLGWKPERSLDRTLQDIVFDYNNHPELLD